MGVKNGRDKADTQERILGAATELFIARGYERTTVSDIAELAGVSRATVFWHFRDKVSVFRESFNRMLAPFRASLARRWDDVEAHYNGWSTDGDLFDSTETKGRPARFNLARSIEVGPELPTHTARRLDPVSSLRIISSYRPAIFGPASCLMKSRTANEHSIMCPSESTTGWFSLARISAPVTPFALWPVIARSPSLCFP